MTASAGAAAPNLAGSTLAAMSLALAALAYDPLAPAFAPKCALALVLAVVGLAITLASRRRTEPLALSTAAAAFFALLAWRATSLLWGNAAEARTFGVELAAGAFALLALELPRAEAERLAVRVGSAVGALAGSWSLGAFLDGGEGFALHGGQGNPDWLGLLLATTLPFALHGAWRAWSTRGAPRLPRFAAVLVVAAHLAGLVLAHSRVAWLGAPLAIGLFVLAALPPSARRRMFVPAGLVTLAALALGLAALRGDWSVTASYSGDAPLGDAASGRAWIAARTVDVAGRSLPLGTGLGGFPEAYLDVQGDALRALSPAEAARTFLNATTAHADGLEVLATGGPIAALLFVGCLVFGAARGLRRGAPSAGASIAAFGLVGLGDSPLASPACVLLLGLAFAALPREHRLGGRGALALRALLFGAVALSLRPAAGGWLAARRVTQAEGALPAEARELLEGAARLAPSSGEVALALGLLHLEAGRPEAAQRELERSRPLLANLGTDVALGNARFALGDGPGARAAFERALQRNPGSLRAHTNLALVALSLGDLELAEGHLAVARTLSPGAPKVLAAEETLRRARLERAIGTER